MSAHSTLGPSKAERWINCPGSIALCKKAPPSKPSEHAVQGTVAHDLAEKLVTGKIDVMALDALVGTKVHKDGFDITIDDEMMNAVIDWQALIEKERKALESMGGSKPVEGHAEMRVHAKSVDEEVWGTADFILFKKGKKLVVPDFKYGQGVAVSPVENEQAALYVIGAMDTIAGEGFDEIELMIHQPRTRVGSPVQRWKVPKEWLEKFRATAKAAAAETRKPGAKLAAGDWCRWCDAKPFCPEVREAAQKAAQMDFSVVAPDEKVKPADMLEKVRLLPIEKVGEMLAWKEAVKALMIAAEDVVMEHLSSGKSLEGWKLVDGREGNREWKDEKAVVVEYAPVLGEEGLYERKLLSPAKLEKKLGKKYDVNPLTQREPGRKALARDKDPRPIAATAAQDDFAVVAPEAECVDCALGGCSTHDKKPAPIWPV